MQQKIRKPIGILLSLLMLLSMFGGLTLTAGAASGGTCGENVTWTLDDDGLLTISGTGPMEDYTPTIWSPFKNSSEIKEIVIASGVTNVGNYAFFNCKNLTSATIGDSVETIGTYAFFNCRNLTSVTIGNSLESIGRNAFDSCSNLTSVTIGNGLESIGRYAFNDCSALTDVYYAGSEEEWSNIAIEAGNDSLTDADVHCYTTGDLITYGGYPQTKVTDSDLISSLDSLADSAEWISYDYYSGDGNYGSMQPGDWMKYCDIELNDTIYRGVRFTQYRPNYTYKSNIGSGTSYQDDNGYSTNTTYWFRWESLVWRVLDPAAGLVFCENIIDSQAYSNTIYYLNSNYYNEPTGSVYANDYESSSIRQWLINDFYNTAFSASEQANIAFTPLDNSAYSTSYSQYDSNPTNDKIFLLSYDDVLNTAYGFSSSTDSDSARQASGSDYAKCQGLYEYSGNAESYWRLRSAGSRSNYACYVSSDGNVYYNYVVGLTQYGVRPAFKFSTGIIQSSSNPNGGCTPAVTVCGHANVQVVDPIPATCTTDGNTGYTICLDCDEIVSGENTVIPATDHAWGVWTDNGDGTHIRVCGNDASHVETNDHSFGEYVYNDDATCTEDGTKTAVCADCGATDTIADPAHPATGHAWGAWTDNGDGTHTRVCGNDASHVETNDHSFGEYEYNDDATCTEDGTKTAVCADCGATDTIADPAHPATGHAWGAWADNGDGTHTRVCGNDASHVETNDHNFGEYVYNDDATCTEDGTKTAACADCGATDTVADPAHPATDHNYVFDSFEWADDLSWARAKLVCGNNPAHVTYADAAVTSETTAPTETEDGFTVYTAVYEEHTDSRTVVDEGSAYGTGDTPDSPAAPTDGEKIHGEHCFCYKVSEDSTYGSLIHFFCGIICALITFLSALGVAK